MPRGLPDDNVADLQTAGQVPDVGEVAARQVGIQPIDGLGRTIFFDDFRLGLGRGKRILQGVGSTVFPQLASVMSEYSSTSAVLGAGFGSPYSLRMPLITTLVNTDKASWVFDLMLGQTKRLGIETALWIDTVNTNDTEVSIIYQRTGGTEYNATLYYRKSDQSLRVGNSGGTVLANLNSGTVAWVQVKMVADFETGKYIRFIIGENRYDNAENLTASAVVPDGECNFGVTVIGANPAATRPIYMGYVMLTRDEP